MGKSSSKSHVRRRKEARLLAIQGNACIHCNGPMIAAHLKQPDSMTIEHFWPKALDGSNQLENLALAHMRCNVDRGSKEPTPEHILAQGLLLLKMAEVFPLRGID